MKIFLSLNILILFFLPAIYAQHTDKASISDNFLMLNDYGFAKDTISLPADSSKQKSFGDKAQNFIEKAFKYAPLPFGGYATETGALLGITKYNAWKFKSDILPDSLIQPSSILAYVYFTEKHQYKVYTILDMMQKSNKINTRFEFLLLDYPSLYFGLGNENDPDSGYVVDYKNVMISPSFYYNFYEKVYVGAKYTFNNYLDVKNVDSRPNDSLMMTNEGIQSGLGLHLFRENRDNRINAKRGSYLNISYDIYSKFFGSDFNYGLFIIDYRKYVSPWPTAITFAGQFLSTFSHGDIPIQSMPVVGGAYMMRGIYENRYRDRQMLSAQMEMRFPIFWIISGAAFGGIGQVAPKLEDFRFEEFHPAYGLGLRVLIDEKTSSTLRFDLSFSHNAHTIFVGFNEAF